MHLLLLLLRLIHVVGGMLWVGFALFLSSILAPVLNGLGPDAGKVMGGLQRKGLMTLLPLIALATILSGAGLLWWLSGGQLGDFVSRPMGMTLTLGALAAVIAFLIGVLVNRPTAVQIGATAQRLATATPTEREGLQATLAGLQRRAGMGGRATNTLLLIAAGAMAVARYV